MKEDPIIHAPLSKIVEAIVKEALRPNSSCSLTQIITSALASLGGEDVVPTRQQIIELAEVRYADIGKQEAFIEGVVSVIEKCYLPNTTHPSERELLEGFAHFINTEYNVHMSIQKHIIDRYLAEKQSKTENK